MLYCWIAPQPHAQISFSLRHSLHMNTSINWFILTSLSSPHKSPSKIYPTLAFSDEIPFVSGFTNCLSLSALFPANLIKVHCNIYKWLMTLIKTLPLSPESVQTFDSEISKHLKFNIFSQAPVAHTCNPSSGGKRSGESQFEANPGK
jgi:hypothetical protein